jgi:thymidylate kinase
MRPPVSSAVQSGVNDGEFLVMDKKILLFVTGSGPGLGKSTLADSLSDTLQGCGISVQLFREMDIEYHPAFSAVIGEFANVGEVRRSTLLAAANEYMTEVGTLQVDVVVLDALFAYLPSLLAWGDTDQEILKFMFEISSLFTGFKVYEIHLTGDLMAGLNRAGDREGGQWLDEHVKKVSKYRNAPPITTSVEAAEYLETLALRAIPLLEQAPWEVTFFDAELGAAVVHARAVEFLEPLLP